MTTGALGFGMEFKDRMWGGKFDLLDLLATILIPLILIIINNFNNNKTNVIW